MKHIYPYKNFINESSKSSKAIRKLEHQLYEYGIKNYHVNSDGTIDVYDDVRISSHLKKIPFNFGKVTGNFSCSYSELDSLEGSPYYVGGDFTCTRCNLKSLKGSPIEVVGDFDCFGNEIESLDGMPLEIGKHFSCYNNNLKELNSVSNIEGNILCDDDVDISKFDGHCLSIVRL